MIPSPSWFSRGIVERAGWYQNFNKQAQDSGLTLGLTAADLAQIDADNQVMQFLAAVAVEQEAFDAAVREYRRIITEGDIGDVTPPFPPNPNYALPVVVPTGIFERLSDDYRKRIMASANYTDEQGALYGIIGSSPAPPDPATVQPTIEVTAAQTGNMFSIVVSNRGESDMWDVMILPKGATAWTLAKTATGKSADVQVAANAAGDPQVLQVRVQLKKKNANYGQLSDVVYTTVNP